MHCFLSNYKLKNMELPIEKTNLNSLEMFFERLKCSLKILFYKKIIITTIENEIFTTEYFEVKNSELAIASKIILLKLTEDEDLNSKLKNQLETFNL